MGVGENVDMSWIREQQRFKNKKELDLHVRSFLYKRKAALSEGTIGVLTFIWRHAVKYPGVAFPKRATIVQGTGLSESTVIRSLRCLVQEGLIMKVATKKPNGRQGGNLLVFLPQTDVFLPSDDTPPDTLRDTPEKTIKGVRTSLKRQFQRPKQRINRGNLLLVKLYHSTLRFCHHSFLILLLKMLNRM